MLLSFTITHNHCVFHNLQSVIFQLYVHTRRHTDIQTHRRHQTQYPLHWAQPVHSTQHTSRLVMTKCHDIHQSKLTVFINTSSCTAAIEILTISLLLDTTTVCSVSVRVLLLVMLDVLMFCSSWDTLLCNCTLSFQLSAAAIW